MEEAFDEPKSGGADNYCPGLCETLQPGGNVGRLAHNRHRVRVGAVPQVTDDCETGVNGDANLQRFRQPRTQPRNSSENIETCAHRTPRVIFVRNRVAEKYQEAIAEVLSNVSSVTGGHVCANPLILPGQVVQLLGIELSGKLGGADQVTEHYSQSATLGAWIYIVRIGISSTAAERGTALIAKGNLLTSCGSAFRAAHCLAPHTA
jgi:hypothetical protein